MNAPGRPAVRWGLLGAGRIASKFARDLALDPGSALHAVASRSAEKAGTFCPDLPIPRRYGSYSDLAGDPEVDVVYVATPHAFHRDHAVLCLDAGKAVLCEKPFALNRRQAADMTEAARRNGVFLMEAMWTRFMPHILSLAETVRSGAIGRVETLSADFGFAGAGGPGSRLFDPRLGGGALLDVGVYPITLAFLLLGRPVEVRSAARIGPTGVDGQCGMVFAHADGALALLSASVTAQTPQEAAVSGSSGIIRLRAPWWRSGEYTVFKPGGEPETVRRPVAGNGFVYEIAEAAACIRSGKMESGIMPLAETLAVMEVMDRMRGSWGMFYPGE